MPRDVALDPATPSAERSQRGLSVAACGADISSASMHAPLPPLPPRNSAPLLPSRAPAAVPAFATKSADHGAGGEAWRPLVRGSCASLVNVVATFPMNKMMFRQQAEGHTVQQAAHFMKLEGMGLLYRGLAPPLLQKSISTGVMFGAYDHFYQALSSSGSSSSSSSRLLPLPPGVAHTIAALVSGALEATLAPFERVQTLLQSRAFTLTIGNSREAVALLRPLGVAEFYRGGSAVLLRNGPSTALFFGLREPLRSLLPGGGGGGGGSGASDSASASDTLTGSNGLVVPAELVAPMLVPSSAMTVGVGASGSGGNSLLHMFNDFVSGAVLGAGISTLAYPLNTARIHMQQRVGGPRLSIGAALRECVAERGGSVLALYRGVWLNASRALVSWGIINATYELLRESGF